MGSAGRKRWLAGSVRAGMLTIALLVVAPLGVLAGIPEPPDSSNPRDLAAAGTRLLFGADDGVHGRELWRTDGTGASTKSRSGVSVYWQRTDRSGAPTPGSIARRCSASSASIALSGSLVRSLCPSLGLTDGPPQSCAALTVGRLSSKGA